MINPSLYLCLSRDNFNLSSERALLAEPVGQRNSCKVSHKKKHNFDLVKPAVLLFFSCLSVKKCSSDITDATAASTLTPRGATSVVFKWTVASFAGRHMWNTLTAASVSLSTLIGLKHWDSAKSAEPQSLARQILKIPQTSIFNLWLYCQLSSKGQISPFTLHNKVRF